MTDFTKAQLNEIETISRRRARKYVSRVFVGYTLLAIGTGYGIASNAGVIQDSKSRGQVVRAVICEILKDSDEKGIAQIPAEAKLLHISQADLEAFTKPNLERTAEYRAKLKPSNPEKACDPEPIALPNERLRDAKSG